MRRQAGGVRPSLVLDSAASLTGQAVASGEEDADHWALYIT